MQTIVRHAVHQPLNLVDAVEFVINLAGDGQARAYKRGLTVIR